MMSSRERVLLAIGHKEPDRMPVAPPQGRVNLDDEVLRFIEGPDFDSFVDLNLMKNLSDPRKISDETLVDNYGCIYKYKGVGSAYCIYNPLANAKNVRDIEKYEKWPDPNDRDLIFKDAHKTAKKLYEETDHITSATFPGIFSKYWNLRGFDQWLIDMKTNPELYKAIADRLHNVSLASTLRLLNEIGDYTNLVMFFEDMGGTTSPFMSVEDFRRFVKPYYKETIGEIKREFSGIKFWFHCHGYIIRLVPDFIDSGVDVLNPVLPGDNMNPQILKKEFGGRLCFDGGVDVESVTPFGTTNEVREHAKKVIEVLSPGGGYIFRVQMISNVVPRENLYTIYRTALEYGAYES